MMTIIVDALPVFYYVVGLRNGLGGGGKAPEVHVIFFADKDYVHG